MNFIGYFAAVCTTLAFIPQAVKIYKTKQTKDISLNTFTLMVAGTGMWLVYGIYLESMPIISANLITLFLAVYIFYMKIRLDVMRRA